ncbi:MAG TPA: glycosyltransferase family 4 protein [Candidatus Nanoarchaeia archaeon]|nr:glycosyltransferase family 4 protein [Candidatus Nanoarchaeia archaeon]
MLGWEFPPFFAGGAGIVCYEMAKALTEKGHEVTYIMPFGPKNVSSDAAKLIVADQILPGLRIQVVDSLLTAYVTSEEYRQQYDLLRNLNGGTLGKDVTLALYGRNLFEEIIRFALRARVIAASQSFDVIHAQDWTTFPAAVAIKKASGKPLVVHVHNTVFDRYLNSGNSTEYSFEKAGMEAADLVIAISHYVKNRIVDNYGIPAYKVRVVHNATPCMQGISFENKLQERVVLFAGRVTIQKGPDYFVEAARRVLEKDPKVRFVMAGSGDMLPQVMQRVAELGLLDKFWFTGFYNREEAEKLFSMASVCVMPSVSEPFGVIPLESLAKDTPVIISKQSGVSEVLQNALKVDFWDTEDMANKILAILHYKSLHRTLQVFGKQEAQQLTWDKVADKLISVYDEVVPKQLA